MKRARLFSPIAWSRVAVLTLGIASTVPLAAQPEPADTVVMLPPLTVTERGTPLQWRYLQLPGMEILSVCDDSTSVAFAQRLRRLDDLLATLLPPRFLAKSSVSETMILLDEKTGQARSREVLADLKQGASRLRFMPNLRLDDLDVSSAFAVIPSSTTSTFTYAPERIASFLERRTPRLPDWFMEGMTGFYQQLELRDQDVFIRPTRWLNAQETAAFAKDAERPRTLLSMEELFTGQRRRAENASEVDRIWRAQSALFVRWACTEDKGAYKEALWKFVDRLETQAPTEALFRECFGLGYSDMRDRLSDYLPPATQERITLPVRASARTRLRFRAATDLEVARIRGDWERMEINYVRQRSPQFVDKYIDQALRTLTKVYDQGEKDPRLLATLGLAQLDAGNSASARLFLEAAVKGGVVRPRAYYELARLRYESFVHDLAPEQKIPARQAADVIAPLLASRGQDPALLQSYALMLQVLARSETPPTAEQLAALHGGARDFRHSTDLVVRVIYFHLSNGQTAAAATLVDLALAHAVDSELRTKLERLRDNLASLPK